MLDTSIAKDWVPTEVHNWDGKESNVLVLNYTMQCPLACDFCCYSCHSKRDEKMPFELAESLINQAGKLGNFSSVGFTGGEPMLFFNEILELGDCLIKNKLPFTIATAGHWAETYDIAYEMLLKLKNKGLLRINISHDPSHAKFVSSEFILNAANAASDLKIPTYIVGTFFKIGDSLEKLIPTVINKPFINLHNKFVAKVGRASKRDISQKNYDINLELENLCCYRRIYHDIVVFWDGEAYPCCSTFNRDTPGISLGNVNNLSLQDIFEKADGSLKFRIMKRESFFELYEIIKSYKPELFEKLPSVDETVGPCSLCNAIFKNPEITKEINEVFEVYEIERINNALEYLTEKIGLDQTTTLVNQILT